MRGAPIFSSPSGVFVFIIARIRQQAKYSLHWRQTLITHADEIVTTLVLKIVHSLTTLLNEFPTQKSYALQALLFQVQLGEPLNYYQTRNSIHLCDNFMKIFVRNNVPRFVPTLARGRNASCQGEVGRKLYYRFGIAWDACWFGLTERQKLFHLRWEQEAYVHGICTYGESRMFEREIEAITI